MIYRILTIISFFFFINASVKADNWFYSFEEAQKVALASNKLILVDFWANWCGPCKKMDAESWSTNEIKILMENYVPVKIDIDKYKSLSGRYGVRGIPYIFIMDGNGKVIFNEMSYKSKGELIKLLQKYAINTSYLNTDLINYYKNPNFNTSFRLASKYQDFSIFLNSDIKFDFLKITNSYFDEAKKYLKKSEIKNKDAFFQKIDLFEIQEKIILNKPEKALKMLKRIDDEDVEEINKSFYSFLYYAAYKEMDDLEKMNDWKEKVLKRDIEKADLILNNIS